MFLHRYGIYYRVVHVTKTSRKDIIKVMEFVQVLWYYTIWHYTKAWGDIFRIIANYLWFVGNFFSINLLLRTLFSPWRRLGARSGEESIFGTLVINFLMRFIGFGMRLGTVIVGALSLLLTMALGSIVLLAWLFLPIIVFFLFFAGLGYVFNLFS